MMSTAQPFSECAPRIPAHPSLSRGVYKSSSAGLDLSTLDRLRNVCLHAALNIENRRHLARIRSLCQDPMPAQRRVLARIVSRNRRTTFGIQHGFASIHDYTSFARQVPVMSPAQLHLWLRYHHERDPHALHRGAAPALATDPARTSASVRARLVRQHALAPDAFDGALLMLDATLARAYAASASFIRGKLVLPDAIYALEASELFDLLALRLALAAPDVTYVQTPDAACLLRWTALLERHHRFLFKDLRHGEFFLTDELPAVLRAPLTLALRPMPAHARALAAQRALHGPLTLADVWPAVRLMTVERATALDESLCNQWPKARLLPLSHHDAGFAGGYTLDQDGGTMLPAVDEHFFEFAPCAAWEAGQPQVHTLENLSVGETYFLIVSHVRGLYRHMTGDRVRIVSRRDQLAVMRRIDATHDSLVDHSSPVRMAT